MAIAGLLASGSALADTTPAALSAYSCQRALDPPLRGISVTALMRPVPGTERMQLRFDLLRARHLRGPYHAVHGPNLGRWLSPRDPQLGRQPGDLWRVPHPVVGLSAPAFYRLRVSFRWLGAGNRRLDQRLRMTPTCHQPELRPDLAMGSLTITPSTAHPGADDYVAVIRNRGVTGTGPFYVQLTLPDGSTASQSVGWLGARSGRRLRFLAAACTAGTTVTAVADPAGTIDDFDPADNALQVSCPATNGG